MAFAANPLSLSVPDPTFESWLRDSGYLEVLDQRTSDLHRISTATTTTATTTTAAAVNSTSSTADPPSAAVAATGFFLSAALSYIGIIFSLLTLNPFSKLTNEDFSSGGTPSWTLGFFGYSGSYSLPSSRSQARMRVTENVKRYCRNYATLFIVFFACSLYQIPIALVGLISSLALWDLFAYCGKRWSLDDYPIARECLLRLLQCATAVIIFVCNVQMALLCAIGVSYAVMMLHASFRKLTPVKQTTKAKPK